MEKNINTYKITRKDRSHLVKDDNYGFIQTFDLEKIDTPVFENTEELEKYLEFVFIPDHVKTNKNRFGKNTNSRGEEYKVIRLSDIIRLRLSEMERKYTIKYIESQGIRIIGTSQNYDSEFDSYDYVRTYRNNIETYTNTLYDSKSSAEENFRLFTEYNKTHDPKIREEIILRNINLVRFMAWKIAYHHNIEACDAEGYGYEGLIRAVDNYKLFNDQGLPNNIAFSTYAVRYIAGYIKNKLINDQTGFFQSRNFYYQFKKLIYFVEKNSGIRLDEDKELINDVIDLFIAEYNYPIHKRDKLYSFFLERFDTLSEDDFNESWNTEEFDFEQKVFDEELSLGIQKLLEELLSLREKEILNSRFGLSGKEIKSTRELAEEFKVSTERINQIRRRALKKIKNTAIEELQKYWDSINGLDDIKKKGKN